MTSGWFATIILASWMQFIPKTPPFPAQQNGGHGQVRLNSDKMECKHLRELVLVNWTDTGTSRHSAVFYSPDLAGSYFIFPLSTFSEHFPTRKRRNRLTHRWDFFRARSIEWSFGKATEFSEPSTLAGRYGDWAVTFCCKIHRFFKEKHLNNDRMFYE